jgi:FkbM family methyltransferase
MRAKTRKFLVRSVVRRTGWDIVRFCGDFESLQRRLLREEQIDCVVDVGANEGQYAQRMRQLGYRGEILALEPIAEAFERLSTNFSTDAAFHAEQIAAGSSSQSGLINISSNSVSSSMLPMTDRHTAADPKSAYDSVQTTTVRPLDALDISGTRIWLKLDVQGTEDKVLEGAEELLMRTQAVQVELSLVPLYKGAPLVEDLVAQLRHLGFEPVYLEPGFSDPRTGVLLQVEGLFRRR